MKEVTIIRPCRLRLLGCGLSRIFRETYSQIAQPMFGFAPFPTQASSHRTHKFFTQRPTIARAPCPCGKMSPVSNPEDPNLSRNPKPFQPKESAAVAPALCFADHWPLGNQFVSPVHTGLSLPWSSYSPWQKTSLRSFPEPRILNIKNHAAKKCYMGGHIAEYVLQTNAGHAPHHNWRPLLASLVLRDSHEYVSSLDGLEGAKCLDVVPHHMNLSEMRTFQNLPIS